MSFNTAEEIIGYLCRFGYTSSNSVILVGNRIDLERSRVISTEGKISGHSYKHFTLINYDSRLVITSKLLILTTLES